MGQTIINKIRNVQKRTEVNKYQEELLPENSDLIFTVGSTPLKQAHQVINRKHIEPVHFELFHLWIDIRNCYH